METETAMEATLDELAGLLDRLRTAGQEPHQELLDQIKALGSRVVPPLIEMATDEELLWADSESAEAWAPLHAIRLLGELQTAEAVEPLLEMLDIDGDMVPDTAAEALGKIGQPALEPLRALLFDRTQTRSARSRAAAGLAEVAHAHPELRDAVVDALVTRLDPAESREPVDEAINGFVISELYDLEAREATPAIRRAFEEDRADRFIIAPVDVQEKFGLPREDWGFSETDQGEGLRLRLLCKSCGYERDHRVETVYYDLATADRQGRGEDTPYDPFIIPKRITCPRCNAVDEYEITPLAMIALTAEIVKLVAESKGEKLDIPEPESRLRYTRFQLTDGREMHPREALAMYEQEVEANPSDADLRVRYGNVLRLLGYTEEAEQQYRTAFRLDPENVEACAVLAEYAAEAERLDEYVTMLVRVLELAPRSDLPREKKQDLLNWARAELSYLENLPAPSGVVSGSQSAGFPGSSLVRTPGGTVRVGTKVGRNEPCPCGSGKKYKKCHGA